jgi:hypothetical protein
MKPFEDALSNNTMMTEKRALTALREMQSDLLQIMALMQRMVDALGDLTQRVEAIENDIYEETDGVDREGHA